MFYHKMFKMWGGDGTSASTTIILNARRRYLVTGGLTGKKGDDYGQVYISSVCILDGDQVLCGVRGESPLPYGAIVNMGHLWLTEIIENATRVTVKLRTGKGLHRAEGVVYDIT